MKRVKLTIPNFFGGFAPNALNETYPSYGNKNMAGDMRNVELANLSHLTQGAGLSDYPGFPGYKVLLANISTTRCVGIANASANTHCHL